MDFSRNRSHGDLGLRQLVPDVRKAGVGFFSTLRFSKALPASEQRRWDWNFSHSRLSYGGSLMVWREGDDVLELEGVTFGGDDWPTLFDASEVVGSG